MTQDQQQSWTPLFLDDGSDIAVDERAYPMLMEWEWKYDARTSQAVRSDNSGVRLYDEEIRLLANSEVIMYPMLDRPAIRSLFGGRPEYAALLRLSQRQRLPVLFELDYSLPSSTLLLSSALSAVLVQYYRWLAAPTRLILRADPANLTPGTFESVVEKPVYKTLGSWMNQEVTGGWLADRGAATGLLPEPKCIEVMKLVTMEWRVLTRASNYERISPKKIEMLLKREDYPVWLTVQHVIELIETYAV